MSPEEIKNKDLWPAGFFPLPHPHHETGGMIFPKPLIEEEKKQGLVTDYKVFLKQTKNGPEDWDICVAIEYKNHAAMDGLAAKGEAARDKILGGKQAAQQLGEKRAEIREIISSELLQEIFLK